MYFLKHTLIENSNAFAANRRQFLKTVAAGSGVFMLGCAVSPFEASAKNHKDDIEHTLVFNAFLKVTPDNKVITIIKHLDKGQGVTTGLTTIVAEELGASWQQMGWEFAPADARRYNNLFWGQAQGTGGSTSIANSWEQLRQAGAAARAMFIHAAAKRWQVKPENISIKDGIVKSGNKSATLGELAGEAAKQEMPQTLKLKNPKDFTLIGKMVPRIDSPEKVNGTAIYTQDIQLPDMLVALVLYPPKLGGKLTSFDAAQAEKMPGVKGVVKIPRGVAVVAENFWAAKKARDTLKAEWDLKTCETRSSEQMFAELESAVQKQNHVIVTKGNARKTIEDTSVEGEVIEASYRLPYLAHATLEPMNCVVKVGETHAELWYGCQMPTTDQAQTAEILGLAPEKVMIHTLFAGGSFGRRACPSDYVVDAVHIAKQFKGSPVKMIWTREDDMRDAKFRPMNVHKVRGKVTKNGEVLAWHHNVAAQSITRGTPFEKWIQGPVDGSVYEGMQEMAYELPNMELQATEFTSPITVLWWRSVGHSCNAFVIETFVDQLARSAGQEPYTFRQKLLKNEPRWLGALNLAAKKADWGKKLARGKGQGIAVHKAMGSWVAQVAEVTVNGKNFTVDRVTCAIDCGLAVNPDIVVAQMEGSIGFALGAVFGEEITIKDGAVEQVNFDTYQPLRMNQMPEIDVHIVPSAEVPSGVGEPGVPPTTPAVANAIYAVTGKPITHLPIKI